MRDQSYPEIEVLVVDNDSDDGTREVIRDEFPEVTLICLPSNLGRTGASNIGFETAEGKYIALLDDDSEIGSQWTSELVNEFERSDLTLGLLQPQVYHPKAPDEKHLFTEPGEISWFIGCGIMARREALQDCGYFDDNYFVYVDDLELAASLLSHGYTLRTFPEVTTVHKRDWEADLTPLRIYYCVRNKLWFYWKYYPADAAIVHSLYRIGLFGLRAREHDAMGAHLRALRDAVRKGWTYAVQERDVCEELKYDELSISDLVMKSGKVLKRQFP